MNIKYLKLQTMKLALSFIMLCYAVDLSAQKPIITLEKLWQEALENSQNIRVNQLLLSEAESKIISVKNSNLPDIDVNLSLGYLGNGYLTDRSFKNGLSVENPHFMNNFAVKASQLIYGGGVIKNAVKMAQIGRDMAQLKLEASMQDIKMMIAGLYLDLCRLHNQTTVLNDNLRLCDIVIANMKVMEQQGTALSNDILRYELQKESLLLSKRKVQDALQIVYRKIATATHHEGVNDFVPDTSMFNHVIDFQVDSLWQQLALNNNINVKIAEAASKCSQYQLNTIKSDNLPKVVVIAEDHFDGPITIEVPVIDKNFNYWFAGVGVQYNLSSLYKNKHNVKRAEIALQTSQEQQVLAQEAVGDNVFAAYTDLLTSDAETLTQQKSVELSGKNYNVTLSRYNNGLVTITDMLDAANTKLDAELGFINSKINTLYNYYKLKYICAEL